MTDTTARASELPGWAVEMRDLFRSGSAAQFLLHGNVFDVVPANGRLLSVPAFLDQVMFASYDVVLRYDRSRGVRATRGGDDWGDWLQNALGREASSQILTREPGAALEEERDEEHGERHEHERTGADDARERRDVAADIREAERGSARRDRRGRDELVLELRLLRIDTLAVAVAPSSVGAGGVLGAGHVASCLRVPLSAADGTAGTRSDPIATVGWDRSWTSAGEGPPATMSDA